MLGLGILCLAAGVASAVLILRAPDAEPRLVVSALLLCAAIVSLARWNRFRGRTYYECRSCGRRWARWYED